MSNLHDLTAEDEAALAAQFDRAHGHDLPREVRSAALKFDLADLMCPNCVTPWKCNGPHEDAE